MHCYARYVTAILFVCIFNDLIHQSFWRNKRWMDGLHSCIVSNG